MFKVAYASRSGTARKRKWMDGVLRIRGSTGTLYVLAESEGLGPVVESGEVSENTAVGDELELPKHEIIVDEVWKQDGSMACDEPLSTKSLPADTSTSAPATKPISARPTALRRRLHTQLHPKLVSVPPSFPAASDPEPPRPVETSPAKLSKEPSRLERLEALRQRYQPKAALPMPESDSGEVAECPVALPRDRRQLVVPSAAEAFAAQEVRVRISVAFPNLLTYRDVWCVALLEWLQLRLGELVLQFHMAAATVRLGASFPRCAHGRMRLARVNREDSAHAGRPFFTCASGSCDSFSWVESGSALLEPSLSPESKQPWNTAELTALRQLGLRIYDRGRLVPRDVHLRATGKAAMVGSRSQENVLYYQLQGWQESSTAYKRGDLWLLSTHPRFDPADSASCVVVAYSRFHGPANNYMELELAADASGRVRSPLSATSLALPFYALHGPGISNELQMLDSVRRLAFQIPCVPFLVSANPSAPLGGAGKDLAANEEDSDPWHLDCVSRSALESFACEASERFGLNEDQAAVLQASTQWFQCQGESAPCAKCPPVLLVHGAFGCGKSSLAVALIRFLVQVSPGLRVLVASTTNVAVDRILVALLDSGFSEVLRIGSLRNMAKALLPHTPQHSQDIKRERAELREMLDQASLPEDRALLQQALTDLDSGAMAARCAQVHSSSVVGTTCSSCALPLLDSARFALVLLDEASQMVEPASLVPIERARASRVVLIGDPLQLPPVLEGFPEPVPRDSLAQTLYARLLRSGAEAFRLRVQYRCHPDISAISNEIFYEHGLRDGVGIEQRKGLVAGWPAALWVGVPGGVERPSDAFRRSLRNDLEAAAVERVVRRCLQSGIEASRVGVISLYLGQVAAIQARLPKEIQVSSVDAFQGSERDVIVVNTVRTSPSRFLESPERVNVALTRARHHLVVVGNEACLRQSSLWSKVLSFLSTL